MLSKRKWSNGGYQPCLATICTPLRSHHLERLMISTEHRATEHKYKQKEKNKNAYSVGEMLNCIQSFHLDYKPQRLAFTSTSARSFFFFFFILRCCFSNADNIKEMRQQKWWAWIFGLNGNGNPISWFRIECQPASQPAKCGSSNLWFGFG